MVRSLERITLAGSCALLAAGAVVSGALGLTHASHRRLVASAGPASGDAAALVVGVPVSAPATPALPGAPRPLALPTRVVHPRRVVVVRGRALHALRRGPLAARRPAPATPRPRASVQPSSGTAPAAPASESTADDAAPVTGEEQEPAAGFGSERRPRHHQGGSRWHRRHRMSQTPADAGGGWSAEGDG